ncbi:hypothetical protein [Halopiger xanaduensis]|uniref:Uncharacterized protein n=1 Tax=Halopiger xanaduensis (strain DSM 18323 / JCM 14033 / SH-6) TaxID=797210 RepID=F8DEP0_HALXS|nr:hypothetical protein [Halopiger xanaduensis]AEH39477.1 hypothetical protein Halxa_0237 [Halopiger xanaduensis SH-6]
MSTTESTETESKRRTAINQLGGPDAAQMYYDADRERPVVLRQKDGWEISKRDYMDRTWSVVHPRCYIGDHGCELETISQRLKLERMESDRYQTLPDATVEAILETARDAGDQWLAVNSPHIPYDGDGGVNVYVDGDRLSSRAVVSETEITAKDHPFEPSIAVHVEYGDDPGPITVETDGETRTYSRANDPDTIEEGVVYEPDDGSDGPTVELRVDRECEDCGETAYDLSGVDV